MLLSVDKIGSGNGIIFSLPFDDSAGCSITGTLGISETIGVSFITLFSTSGLTIG